MRTNSHLMMQQAEQQRRTVDVPVSNPKMVRRLTLQPVKLKSEVVQLACAKMDSINAVVIVSPGQMAPEDLKFGYLTLINARLLEVSFTSGDSTNLLARDVVGALHLTFEEIPRP